MDTIGFVGLGAMGAPMAWNVRSAGFDLQVYNRSEAPTVPFAEDGVPVAESPRAAADECDAVVTIVSNDDALAAVTEGDDGVLAGLDDGAVVVNMSTVSPDATERLATRTREAGGRFVDAPVSGTVGPAEEGTLTVLAGGADDDLEAVWDLLGAMGDPVVDCGDVGDGTRMKLAVNLMLGDVMEALAEGMAFAAEAGLDPEQYVEVLETGALDSTLVRAKGPQILEGDFESRFALDHQFKDLRLALDHGGDMALPLPATAAASEAANAARALGHGDDDMAAMIRYLEAVTGTEVRN